MEEDDDEHVRTCAVTITIRRAHDTHSRAHREHGERTDAQRGDCTRTCWLTSQRPVLRREAQHCWTSVTAVLLLHIVLLHLLHLLHLNLVSLSTLSTSTSWTSVAAHLLHSRSLPSCSSSTSFSPSPQPPPPPRAPLPPSSSTASFSSLCMAPSTSPSPFCLQARPRASIESKKDGPSRASYVIATPSDQSIVIVILTRLTSGSMGPAAVASSRGAALNFLEGSQVLHGQMRSRVRGHLNGTQGFMNALSYSQQQS
eukprot:3862852-Pyramimonas_sp.AAC.1